MNLAMTILSEIVVFSELVSQSGDTASNILRPIGHMTVKHGKNQ
jgi:hypothetical protein